MSEASKDAIKGPSKFGKEWGEQELPVVGVVGAVDDSGIDSQENRIGLSAMQLTNLNMERRGEPLNKGTLFRAVLRNREGLTDDREYGMVIVSFKGNQAFSDVYNAFGELSPDEASSIRVSRKLAEELGLKIGSVIVIDQPKDVLKQDVPKT